MEPNRKGTITEYKNGHYYLSHTTWEDGHMEIEIHMCIPELIWHSCDNKKLDEAKELFAQLEASFPTESKISEIAEKRTFLSKAIERLSSLTLKKLQE